MPREYDFDSWNEIKKLIDGEHFQPDRFPKEGEVWVVALGKNVGSEEDGSGTAFSRPVLIVKKFNNQMLWSIPLSTKQKELDFYYILGEYPAACRGDEPSPPRRPLPCGAEDGRSSGNALVRPYGRAVGIWKSWISRYPGREPGELHYNFTDPNKNNVSAILAQLRLLSIQRLRRKLYNLPDQLLRDVKEKLKNFL